MTAALLRGQAKWIPPRSVLWRLVPLLCAAAIASCYAFTDATFVSWASAPFGIAAALTIVLCVVHDRPARSWAWLAVALGVFCQGAGDFVWVLLSGDGVANVPSPSLADAVYLSGYVAFIVGLIGLTTRRSRQADLETLIDAGILAVGIAVLGWVFVAEPTVAQAEDSPLAIATAAAYPLLDLTLATLLVLAMLTRRGRRPWLDLLALALFAFIASDVVYLRQAIDGSYAGGGLADAGWFLGYVLAGAAALHPSSKTAGPGEAVSDEARFSKWRAASLAAACLVAPVATAWAWNGGRPDHLLMLQGASALMIGLWAVRVTVTVGHLRRTLDDRRLLEDRLRVQAERDPLVGLWNRSTFADRLSHALRAGEPLAVLYLDLDDFKVINDTFGHMAGDAALVQVADRVRGVLRVDDVAARLGGDEFGVLVSAVDRSMPMTIANRILEALLPPLSFEGRTVYLRGSIGISYGSPGVGPDALMREADVAMYLAKGRGKGRFCVFEPDMHQSVMRRIELRSELEHAIARREFIVHFQPIVSADRASLFACEALVRWQHAQRGLLDPDEFIDVAEESAGLIAPLGRFVLEDACREAVRWQQSWPAAPPVSVNVSGVQFREPSFAGQVFRILAETGLRPERLILEVTETTLMQLDTAAATIADLRDAGVRIALDDFGTGYSSLAYLARYPVDILKIDCSFVARLGTGGREDDLAAAMINLSRGLHVEVVAEGVETEAQVERLQALGCGWIQGHVVARPLPGPAVGDLIREWTAAAPRGARPDGGSAEASPEVAA